MTVTVILFDFVIVLRDIKKKYGIFWHTKDDESPFCFCGREFMNEKPKKSRWRRRFYVLFLFYLFMIRRAHCFACIPQVLFHLDRRWAARRRPYGDLMYVSNHEPNRTHTFSTCCGCAWFPCVHDNAGLGGEWQGELTR